MCRYENRKSHNTNNRLKMTKKIKGVFGEVNVYRGMPNTYCGKRDENTHIIIHCAKAREGCLVALTKANAKELIKEIEKQIQK